MIRLTRLNGQEMVLNAEFIERIEACPDTIVTLTTGEQYIAQERVEEIVERVKTYKRSIRLPIDKQ